jgi:hypothetical protein
VADDEEFYDADGQTAVPGAKSLARVPEKARTRAKAAAAMAIAGATDKEIADQLHFVSPDAARTAWEREIAGAYDPTTDYEAMRRLSSARYEALLKSLAPKALNSKIRVPDPDNAGKTILVANDEHLPYSREYRNTLDRIATLHGLNAPQVIKLQSPSQQEFEKLVATMSAQAGLAEDGEGDIFADEQEFEEDTEGVFVPKDQENA